MEETFQDLVRACEKRNRLALLFRLLSSPIYKYGLSARFGRPVELLESVDFSEN